MLSKTVSEALTFTFGDEAQETAKFIDQMDKFFDSFNVSSFDQGRKARKPFQKPYVKPKTEDSEDVRLQVVISYTSITNVLIEYFLVSAGISCLPESVEGISSIKGRVC